MKKALVGNGGHAREVISQMGIQLVRFVDDEYWVDGDKKLMPLSKFDPRKYALMIAVADSSDRENIVKKLPNDTEYFTYIHPTAQIMNKDIVIGKGSFIGANSIITCNIKIGEHAILNRANHIGHDSVIGDFFSGMPGSIISGNVKLGKCVYLGTNSSIREKITICDNVTIGLNTGIVKDIKESGTYAGSPIKKIR